MHDSRGIEIVNFTISLALSAGTLMASAGTTYRLVPAQFYPLDLTYRRLLKSVIFERVIRKIKRWTFLGHRVYLKRRVASVSCSLRPVIGRRGERGGCLASQVRLSVRPSVRLSHNVFGLAPSHSFSFRSMQLVAWHSGRTSVSGRRTFPVLRSTCS